MATNINDPATDYTRWRNMYNAEAEHWKDLQRMGKVFIPIVFLLFATTMSAVTYVFFHLEEWTSNVSSNLGAYWLAFRVFITIPSPIIISIICIVLAYRTVLGYTKTFYRKPGEKKLFSLVQKRLLGIPPLPPPLSDFVKYPSVVIKDSRDLKDEHWIRWLGGPATLVINDGVALYLERGNKFSRVVGPGGPPMPFLERHETVKAVVDLRPQVKTGTVNPWTKDGIQVDIEIRMECQIRASEKAIGESQNLVYTFDPIAVKEAVEYTAVKRDMSGKLIESDWLDGVWGQVSGFVNWHVSCHSVDEIALAELKDVGPSEGNLLKFQLAGEYLQKINNDLDDCKCGVRVTNIHLVMKFHEEVENQRIAYWKSERDRLAIIRNSMAEADGIRIQQEAHANAERDVLDAITTRLQRIDPSNLTEPLLLSLTSILDSSLDDPLIRPIIAKNSLNLLEQLRKTLHDKF